jgi:hypothetical protein
LRKNFGNNTINPIEIIFGALFFGLWAFLAGRMALSENAPQAGTYEAYLNNPIVLTIISGIFIVIALVILIKGFFEDGKNKFNHNSNWLADNYRGQSLLYQKYIKDWGLQMKVWKKLEPAFCFKWSFILLLAHPLLGFPLLFASTAFGLNEYYHIKQKWESGEFQAFAAGNNSSGGTYNGGVS